MKNMVWSRARPGQYWSHTDRFKMFGEYQIVCLNEEWVVLHHGDRGQDGGRRVGATTRVQAAKGLAEGHRRGLKELSQGEGGEMLDATEDQGQT